MVNIYVWGIIFVEMMIENVLSKNVFTNGDWGFIVCTRVCDQGFIVQEFVIKASLSKKLFTNGDSGFIWKKKWSCHKKATWAEIILKTFLLFVMFHQQNFEFFPIGCSARVLKQQTWVSATVWWSYLDMITLQLCYC